MRPNSRRGGLLEALVFGEQAGGKDSGDDGDVGIVFGGDDFALAVEGGEGGSFGGGDAVDAAADAVAQEVVECGEEVVDSEAGAYREGNAAGEAAKDLCFGFGTDEIPFVQGEDGLFVAGAEFIEDADGGVVQFGGLGAGGVDDVDEEVCEGGFLKCGHEGFDEAVGEVADEAHGVGEQHILIVGEGEAACGGVECGEEFVFGVDVGSGEAIEEGGFAGVGVADDGDDGHFAVAAFFALGGADAAHVGEFGAEACDAIAGQAFVHFDLFFAFAACGGGSAFAATGSAALAVEVLPHAGHAWQSVLHAGEFDLERGFSGMRAASEDVEDDFLAVDDADAAFFFPGALLGWADAVVEDDAVAAVFLGSIHQLPGLAFAHEVAGGGFGDADGFGHGDADAEGLDQFGEFSEEGAGGGFFGAVVVDADEHGVFHHFGSLAKFEHVDGHGVERGGSEK